ncbi:MULTISPECIES: GNAT family N-acetyltransferase [unclassified Streptomyces]|uniref:GNAT family N-acetyltransferase n=1 Tax=unclassified Streptomyces TaxID=2593676 RepID=UPI00081F59CD|nr:MULTISPECIES: GNAT family N-acetyltransferase [unclassified Streptomyces]MYR94260.1 GNAT family N-acetyltransferase [Streptomyces sp. SID4937]SCD67762.1 Protein N-acetyltransferase, RimJ/RimL family [Streptomyces sp. ScaeMP-e83]
MNDHGETDEGTLTLSADTLLLRPWRAEDAPALLAAYDDPAMRQWVRLPVSTPEEASRWLELQHEGWESGTRFSFAVTDAGRGGELVGNLALKRPGPGSERAEVGYWTVARAHGRGVAPRALEALTDWAFTTFATEGLVRPELLHQVDNVASCRVAEKAGYAFAEVLGALPPEFPLDGHLHVRRAPSKRAPAQRGPGVSPAGSSDSR